MDTINTAIYKMGVEGQASVDAAGASVDRLAVSEEKLSRATRTSADSVDRLLGRLDPRIRAEQQLQAALAQVNRFEEEGIGTAGQRAQAINAATTRYAEAITRLNGTGAQNTFLGAGNAAKLSAFQLQNLSFQLQDVGQAIATGQPLFRTFIQQGSQIAQIFGPGVGVGGALRALGSGIVTYLTNPLNVAVLAFSVATLAAGALFNVITGGKGESAADMLKRHKDLIDQITKAYGESAAAAREVGAGEDRMLRSTALLAQIEMTDALTRARKNLAASFGTVGLELFGTGLGVANPFANWRVPQGFIDDARKFREDFVKGTADIEAYSRKLDQLGADFPTAENLAFIRSEKEATQAAFDLTQQQKALDAALNGTTTRVIGMTNALRAAFAIGFGSGALAQGLAGANVTRDIGFAGRFDPAGTGAKEAEAAAKKAAEEGAGLAKAQEKAIQGVKDALAFEAAQLGRTSEEQAVYNRLKAAGVDILSQDGMEIAASTRKLFEQEAALKKQIASMDQVRDVAKDVLSGFIGDLNQGKTAVEALAGAFGKLGDKLIDLAAQDLIDQIFGKSGTQGTSGIWSLLGGLFGGGAGVGNVTMGGLYHSGGIVGSTAVPGRYIHPAYFDNAPRLHGGLAADEFPAILQSGEKVIPRGASTGASSNIQMGDIHVHMEGSSGDPVADAKQARAVAETVRGVVREEIFKATKIGGQLNQVGG